MLLQYLLAEELPVDVRIDLGGTITRKRSLRDYDGNSREINIFALETKNQEVWKQPFLIKPKCSCWI